MDGGFPRPVALKAVVHHMGKRVLAREIKVERLRASTSAEDAPYTSGADEAAAPNPSGQGALRILSAAHVAARGRCRWSAGLLALPSEIGAGP